MPPNTVGGKKKYPGVLVHSTVGKSSRRLNFVFLRHLMRNPKGGGITKDAAQLQSERKGE